MVNIHINGRRLGVGLVSRVVAVLLMCRWQDDVHIVLELGEELKGCLHVPWLMREEHPRNAEGSTVHKI